MNGIRGVLNANIHRIQRTLNADKEITVPTRTDSVVCVQHEGTNLLYTVDETTVTITSDGVSKNDTVDVWLFCMCLTENGGYCEMNIDSAKEQKLEDYYDL